MTNLIAENKRYLVQVGKGEKGAYRTRYSFNNFNQAGMYYTGINIGNGYKKRLKDSETGEIIAHRFS